MIGYFLMNIGFSFQGRFRIRQPIEAVSKYSLRPLPPVTYIRAQFSGETFGDFVTCDTDILEKSVTLKV
jgi:hypothetical protein